MKFISYKIGIGCNYIINTDPTWTHFKPAPPFSPKILSRPKNGCMIDDPYLAKTILSFTSIYAGIETKVKKHLNMYFYNN